jgi:calcineurin-like phosphoesterase family protein
MEWCGRPADYEQQLFENMMRIPANDVLIHLGDINIGKDEEMHTRYIKPLQCKKWLAKGNHDRKSYSWYMEHGWDAISEEFKLEFFGKRLVFTHIPIPYRSDFDINIHGHFHNTDHRSQEPELRAFYTEDHHKLISPEFLNYQPIVLNKFL